MKDWEKMKRRKVTKHSGNRHGKREKNEKMKKME